MLQFYRTLREINESSNPDLIPMIYPSASIPPFQLIIPWNNETVDEISLMDGDTAIQTAGSLSMVKYRTESKDTHQYNATDSWAAGIRCGVYRLRIKLTNNDLWYSNLFVYDDFTGTSDTPYNYIEFSNDCRIGPYIFENDWTGILYLDAEILVPEYEDIEEVVVDKDQKESVVSRVSKKTRKLRIVSGDEPLFDALRFIVLNDTLTVNTPFESGEQVVYETIEKRIEDVEWNKEIVSLSLSFVSDDNIVVGSCCDTLCPTVEATVDSIKTDSDFATTTPSLGDTFFISPVTSDSNEWTDNAGQVATYNGSSYDYSYVSSNATINAGGTLYIVNESGITLTSAGVNSLPSYNTTDKLYGVIPSGTMAYITDGGSNSAFLSRDDLFNGYDGLPSGSYDITVSDINSCGTWNTATIAVTIP